MATSAALSAAAKNVRAMFHGISATEETLLMVSRGLMRHLIGPLIVQMGISQNMQSPVKFLDLACGTGVASSEVQMRLPKAVREESSFIASDLSPDMVEIVKKRIEAEEWLNTETMVLDAQNTGLADDSLSHVAIGLGLHLIPDPDAVVKDCVRILQPGGTFGASTFARRNRDMFWIADMRAAFDALPYDAPLQVEMQMHKSGHWDDAAWVESHLRSLGLEDVTARESPGSYHLSGVDEYMMAFDGMLRWVRNSYWSEEVKEAHSEDEVRSAVRKFLEEKYGEQGWDVNWVTIVVTGKVPGTPRTVEKAEL